MGIQSSVLNACNKLVTLMRDQPDLKQHLINNATIIQTVNLLEACEQKRDVLLAVLQLVNEVCHFALPASRIQLWPPCSYDHTNLFNYHRC
jgi:hypothetical protein